MGRFYETTFFDSFDLPRHDGRAVVGWQVLASPPSINGQHIPYKKLLRDLGKSRPVEGYGLPLALQFVGDPTSPWASQPFDVPPAPPAKGEPQPALVRRVGEHVEVLMGQPFFAAETSPLRARSLAELCALATTSVVVSIGDLPAIVLVGEAVGLIVIRPLAAVGGALWEGARGEVVDFGADTAASLLDALRRRLGIRRRGSRLGRLKPS